jgi:hypothetical protein
MVLTTGQIKNSQIFVDGVGLSLGENHFLANSLTWRELLTGLTTYLFNQSSAQFQQGEDNKKGSI